MQLHILENVMSLLFGYILLIMEESSAVLIYVAFITHHKDFELEFSYRGNRITLNVDPTILDSDNYTFFDTNLIPATPYIIYIHSFNGTEESDSTYTLSFSTLPAGE